MDKKILYYICSTFAQIIEITIFCGIGTFISQYFRMTGFYLRLF